MTTGGLISVSHLQGKDVGVIEGVMGLFDGRDGRTEAGSTAEMAKWLKLPVILVVDASAMARSVAALVHGFQSFDRDLDLAGVVFNRIGGPGHLRYLQEALEGVPGITILGGLPLNHSIAIPERHLGLIPQEEHGLTPERINQLASFIEGNLDLDLLLQMSNVRDPGGEGIEELSGLRRGGKKVRFGVARDEAFCFYYPDNLELLAAAEDPRSAGSVAVRRSESPACGGGVGRLALDRSVVAGGAKFTHRARGADAAVYPGHVSA